MSRSFPQPQDETLVVHRGTASRDNDTLVEIPVPLAFSSGKWSSGKKKKNAKNTMAPSSKKALQQNSTAEAQHLKLLPSPPKSDRRNLSPHGTPDGPPREQSPWAQSNLEATSMERHRELDKPKSLPGVAFSSHHMVPEN